MAAPGADAGASDPAVAAAPWQVSRRLVRAALDGADDAELVGVLGAALAEVGVGLAAIEVACDVVDLDRADRIIRWEGRTGEIRRAISATDLFRSMLHDAVTERRLGGGLDRALRDDHRAPTNAIALAGHLAPAVSLGFFDDVMTLFVANRPTGLAESEMELLRQVVPVFALAIGARLNAAAARTLLQTYLGQDAATALLDGRVSLGDVATIRAVVIYADLLGFTAMTEKLDAPTLIDHLNLFFETITRPVAGAGGQVAGHVGDSVVMFFPIPDAAREASACAAAIEAALTGLRALGDLNDGAQRLTVPLRARIGIDMGDVVHGNVGSAGRFSFTIIGTPVNRAARLQALAKDLGAIALMPASVAKAADVPCRAFGRHVLRGLERPVDVVGLSCLE